MSTCGGLPAERVTHVPYSPAITRPNVRTWQLVETGDPSRRRELPSSFYGRPP